MKNYVFKRILLTTSVACGALFVSGNVNAATVSTWEEFKAAIAAGESEIILADNLTATDIITITSPVSIKSADGQVYKISAADGLKFSDSFIKYTGTSSSPLLNLTNVQISNTYRYNNANGGTYSGGVISNSGKIGTIDGVFSDNKMEYNLDSGGHTRVYGGIIYNSSSGSIDKIGGTFSNNDFVSRVPWYSLNSWGGIISNQGTINEIDANFIGNTMSTEDYRDNYTYGGIIQSSGKIGTIKGLFKDNTLKYYNYTGYWNEQRGSLMYIQNGVDNIYADFINNSLYNEANDTQTRNHASLNLGFITLQYNNINDFVSSFAENKMNVTLTGNGNGVVRINDIYQTTAKNIVLDMHNNKVDATAEGYIYYESFNMEGDSTDVTFNNSKFYENETTLESTTKNIYASGLMTVSSSGAKATFNNVLFKDNITTAVGNSTVSGGGIKNNGTLNINTALFENNLINSTNSANGGAISNAKTASIIADFVGNKAFAGTDTSTDTNAAARGGAVYNSAAGTIEKLSGVFSDNKAYAVGKTKSSALGGAVYNKGNLTLSNIVMADNNAVAETGTADETNKPEALGGAVYNLGDLHINGSDGFENIISGNKATTKIGETENTVQNGIYTAAADKNVFVNMTTDSKLFVYDTIDGVEAGYNLKFDGDETGQAFIYNNIINANIFLDNMYLNIAQEEYLDNAKTLTLSSGHLDLMNGKIGTIRPAMTLTGNVLLSVDVDLANKVMDRFADGATATAGKLTISQINLLSDALQDIVYVPFAEDSWRDKVDTTVTDAVYSSIYKYTVSYEADGDENGENRGSFKFVRTSVINPNIEASSIAGIVNGAMTQGLIYQKALQGTDNAALIGLGMSSGDEKSEYAIGQMWIRPFLSKENVDLKYSNTVRAQARGMVFGIDSNDIHLDNGGELTISLYGAVVDSDQKFEQNKVKQTGGNIGGSIVATYGDFFAAVTANIGMSDNKVNTVTGKDNFNIYLGGVAFKTGYNISLNESKDLIIQPNFLTSYTALKTENYHTSAGVHVKSDMLHVVEIAPGFKLIKEYDHGFKAYATVTAVWNVIIDGEVRANDVVLPDLSVKPYIEYGFGFEKDWSQEEWNPVDLTTFAQIVRRDGGREGWAGTAGIKWSF